MYGIQLMPYLEMYSYKHSKKKTDSNQEPDTLFMKKRAIWTQENHKKRNNKYLSKYKHSRR